MAVAKDFIKKTVTKEGKRLTCLLCGHTSLRSPGQSPARSIQGDSIQLKEMIDHVKKEHSDKLTYKGK